MKKINFNNKSFLVLLALVSFAFLLIIQPFLTSILWACILAISFYPVHTWIMAKMPNWPNIASLISVCVCTFVLVIPFILLSMFLIQELLNWYQNFQISKINLTGYLDGFYSHLPEFVINLLGKINLDDPTKLQNELLIWFSSAGQFITGQLISFGQNAISFAVQLVVIIYLMFFLFRDGQALTESTRQVIPIDKAYLDKLIENFTTVVLATVKGSLVIAILQGAAAGIMLWCFGIPNVIMWSVVMTILSLLPIVGASLVWGPIAIYFIATGHLLSGIIMIAFGSLIIGLMDNFLRPILVGKGTKLPDYVVLLATVGGMYLFGFIGFVLGPVIAALFVSVWTFFGELQAAQTFDIKPVKK